LRTEGAERLIRLQSLRGAYVSMLEPGVLAMLAKMRNLQKLHLRLVDNPNLAPLAELPLLEKLTLVAGVQNASSLGQCKKLTTLELYRSEMDDLSSLPKCSSLRRLALVDMKLRRAETIATSFPCLEELYLSGLGASEEKNFHWLNKMRLRSLSI